MFNDDHFNSMTYETVKAHLKSSLEHVIAAGYTVREFSEFILDRFGDTYTHHLRQVLGDVSNGEIDIAGLSMARKRALVGRHISVEEREAMIREAAYYRAERRGFTTGGEADDWAAAEREVDTRLAEEAGLIDKGRKVLELTATSVEGGFENLKAVVTAWLEEKHGSVKRNVGTKKAAAKKEAKKTSIPSKAAAKKETAAKAVRQEENKATRKSVKKKAAPKKVSTKGPSKEKTAKKKAVAKKAAKKQ